MLSATGERRYDLGKVDYHGSGRRNCKAAITWKIDGDRFSMCAEIWNTRETDCETCGQCVDTVAAFFPHDKKAQRMVEIWRRWHLNDMKVGSAAQEAWLQANPVKGVYPDSYYWKASEALKAAGLNPDPGCVHNGKPYVYGSAWLHEALPDDVRAEIEAW